MGVLREIKKENFGRELLQMAKNNLHRLDGFGHISTNLNEKVIF